MNNPWFRMYSEWIDDEKVQMLPFDLQRHLVALFCVRCKRPTDQMTSAQLAFRMKINETELERCKKAFLAEGFIDENWVIINWNKRQFVSDSSTIRVQKFREKQAKKRDETFQKRDDETNCSGIEQIQIRTDTDTDQKKKVKTLGDEKPDSAIRWVEIWNNNRGALAGIRKLTSDLKKQIKERQKEFSDEEFTEAVIMCASMPFTTGVNNQKWEATFSWLLRGKTAKNDGAILGQVLNGKYGSMPEPKDEYVEVTPEEWWGKDKP